MTEKTENGAPFYITTPIYYVNDVPHIGHAYTTVACDALARWNRMCGRPTRFLTGTDEHGQKIEQAAAQQGLTPIALCDRVVVNFQRLWGALDITNDDFIRTTEERHIRVAQHFFRTLRERGDIYKGSYEGWYCVPCETYVPEAQLDEGKVCPECGRPLTRMAEESYFFRLSKYQDALIAHYEKHPDAILPRSRYNEVLSFIRGGLQDLSVSRTTLKWGIPVPGDEAHVLYVWLDALVNYLSALGYPAEDGLWKTYWPAARHVVGKDIIRFHAVIWPAILMAMGLEPPVRIFAHGWWTVSGDKMSKSKGNVVDPFEMADRYGTDAFRYFLLREVPFGNDGDFSELALVQRINADLANDIGNLLNRTLQMIEKYRAGALPDAGVLARAAPVDEALRLAAEATRSAMCGHMDRFALDAALKELWMLIGAGNKYIDETQPWKLGKEDPEGRLDIVLRTLWEILRLAALLVSPFLPETSRRMAAQLGLDADAPPLLDGWRWGAEGQRSTIAKGDVLFPRIDLKKWEEERAVRQVENVENQEGTTETTGTPPPDAAQAAAPGGRRAQVEIEDFKKLEIRVAAIERVETVEKADRLYKIYLDVGFEKRMIVSSIREFFTPEELVGRKILVLCNLKPAKFRGIESNGMLLAAESDDGEKEILSLATVDDDFPVGALVN